MFDSFSVAVLDVLSLKMKINTFPRVLKDWLRPTEEKYQISVICSRKQHLLHPSHSQESKRGWNNNSPRNINIAWLLLAQISWLIQLLIVHNANNSTGYLVLCFSHIPLHTTPDFCRLVGSGHGKLVNHAKQLQLSMILRFFHQKSAGTQRFNQFWFDLSNYVLIIYSLFQLVHDHDPWQLKSGLRVHLVKIDFHVISIIHTPVKSRRIMCKIYRS